MIFTTPCDNFKLDSAVVTYDTIEHVYHVNTYKDGHLCCRCEFHAYEDEEGIEPIIFAHWVRATKDGLWLNINISDIKRVFEPICSHCGKRFGIVALNYKRCPECGARMIKVDGDDY